MPTRWAKQIVAMRPDISCRMCRSRAEVGEALALPTPTPVFWLDVSCLSSSWMWDMDLGGRLWRRGGLLLSCRRLEGSPGGLVLGLFPRCIFDIA